MLQRCYSPDFPGSGTGRFYAYSPLRRHRAGVETVVWTRRSSLTKADVGQNNRPTVLEAHWERKLVEETTTFSFDALQGDPDEEASYSGFGSSAVPRRRDGR